jgi:hypothetical protein
MIYDEIKKANVQAMRDKDTVARSIYSVLLNKIKLEEIKKREKNEELVDADIFNILQKSIKEMEEEKANYEKVGNADEVKTIATQIEIANKYLPKMMSDEEIKDVINSLEDKTIPNVMKHFKANYNGKCDMKKVSEILKGLSL